VNLRENTTANRLEMNLSWWLGTTEVRVQSRAYNGVIMISRNIESPSVSEICAHVKDLGYSASKRVRLYGEDYEVVSDPFPEADGIAVHVTTRKDSKIRVLQIPATVLHGVRGRRRPAA
jgi:hypothetical protein